MKKDKWGNVTIQGIVSDLREGALIDNIVKTYHFMLTDGNGERRECFAMHGNLMCDLVDGMRIYVKGAIYSKEQDRICSLHSNVSIEDGVLVVGTADKIND